MLGAFDQEHPLDAGIYESSADEKPQLSDRVVGYWLEIARWCNFLGVLYLVFALVILLALFMAEDLYIQGNLNFIIYLAIYSSSGFLYWRFGNQIQRGHNRSENESIESGFKSLFVLYLISVIWAGLTAVGFLFIIISVILNLN